MSEIIRPICTICNQRVHGKLWTNAGNKNYPMGAYFCDLHKVAFCNLLDLKGSLTFEELHRVNFTRCETVFHPIEHWSPTDWATALAGEVGEACNIIKKLRRLDGADHLLDTPQERERLVKLAMAELADVQIYLDLLATRLNMSVEDGDNLETAVIKKFNEVSDRRNCTIKL